MKIPNFLTSLTDIARRSFNPNEQDLARRVEREQIAELKMDLRFAVFGSKRVSPSLAGTATPAQKIADRIANLDIPHSYVAMESDDERDQIIADVSEALKAHGVTDEAITDIIERANYNIKNPHYGFYFPMM